MSTALVIAAGLVAEMAAWRAVALRRADVWKLMPVVLAAMGLVAAVIRGGDLALGSRGWAAAGVASGAVFYGATRAFVWAASQWEPFRVQTQEKYREAAEVPLTRSLLLSVLVMVPAEELFWRGLTQQHLASTSLTGLAAALVTWFLYLAANLPSASLPIIAGAVVGGALWAALWSLSGGVLAPLGSHILWTGLMLAFPPGAGQEVVRA